MNKFSIIVEKLINKKYFKINSEIDLVIESESEGEASYIADTTLASVKNQSIYVIKDIEEISKEDYQNLLMENINEQNKVTFQPDTQFHIDINSDSINWTINLPTNLNLTPKEAKVLNENIHNVMKLVLAPYFRK